MEESFNAEFDQPVISTLSRPDSLDLSRLVLNVDNPFNMTEDKYKEILKQYRRHQRNPQVQDIDYFRRLQSSITRGSNVILFVIVAVFED